MGEHQGLSFSSFLFYKETKASPEVQSSTLNPTVFLCRCPELCDRFNVSCMGGWESEYLVFWSL